MVSSYLPYPLYSGGHIRLFNLIKELSKRHTITLVCEKRSYQTERDMEEVKKFCDRVETFDRKKQWSLATIFKTGFSLNPFLITGHTLPSMKKRIEDLLLENKFDVLHVETFYVMQNIPKVTIPIVLAEHNVEYLVYGRFASQASVVARPLLSLDIAKMKYWENFYWKKVSKLIAVSDEEKLIMQRKDAEVVPNGVDLNQFKAQNAKLKFKNEEKRILFIGDFRWVQNVNAVKWIINEIWPQLNIKLKNENSKLDIKLWIVGRSIPDSIKKLTKDTNIIFDENASDKAYEIFQKAYVLIAPIRVGGGTSYKILEAMASGVPVVTTSLGIEGIDAQDNKEVIISDNTDAIVSGLITLLNSEQIYKMISGNARKLIEEKHDWKLIVKKLEEVYNSAVVSI